MRVYELNLSGNFFGAIYIVAANGRKKAFELAKKYPNTGLSFTKSDWKQCDCSLLKGVQANEPARVIYRI